MNSSGHFLMVIANSADPSSVFCHPSTTISLCSGYGTETSDSSSDTDIDAVVNEYREEASLPTTMRECSRSDLELKGRGCQLDDTGPQPFPKSPSILQI